MGTCTLAVQLVQLSSWCADMSRQGGKAGMEGSALLVGHWTLAPSHARIIPSSSSLISAISHSHMLGGLYFTPSLSPTATPAPAPLPPALWP